MGGSESFVSNNPYKFAEQDLLDFQGTGVSEAEINKLRSAQRRVGHSSDGSQELGVFSADGERLDHLVQAYNAWAEKSRKQRSEYNEYVDASKKNPGRKQTMLVPDVKPAQTTMLGVQAPLRKSLLGDTQ